jgi:hypothetical protein
MKAVVLAVVGGLLLAGGTTAAWVRDETPRDVGGLQVAGDSFVAGTAFAGGLVGIGLAAVLFGLALVALRGPVRRLAGTALGLLGLAGLAGVGVGLVRAGAEPGSIAAGPGVAGLGAAAITVGAVFAVARPRPRRTLPPRYDLDEDADAEEWHRASVEPDA